MIAVLLSAFLQSCPAYAELPAPPEGLGYAYERPGQADTALGLGERIRRLSPRGVESVQYVIPPGGDPVEGRRVLSAIGGLLVLEFRPARGGPSSQQRMDSRDLERVAAMRPGEEIQVSQEFSGGAQAVTVTFEGCETFGDETVSVYRTSSPQEQRTVFISHETGWWVHAAGAGGELSRISRNF